MSAGGGCVSEVQGGESPNPSTLACDGRKIVYVMYCNVRIMELNQTDRQTDNDWRFKEKRAQFIDTPFVGN